MRRAQRSKALSGRLPVLVLAVLTSTSARAMTSIEFAEHLRRAQSHVRGGELSQAIRIYESLIDEEPSNERVVRGYASALRQSGRFEDALLAFERGDEGQAHPRFLVERITLLRQLERRDEALSLCLENLNTPRSIRQFVQDEMLSLADDLVLWRRAYDDLRLRAKEGVATDAVSTALAEICLEGGRYEEAVAVTRSLDRALGAGGLRLLTIAKRLEALGKPEIALEVVAEVVPDLENAADRRDAALFRAGLEVKLGHPGAAYEGLTWLVARNPRDRHLYEIHLERAQLLAGSLGKPDHAIAIYDTLLAESKLLPIHEQVRLARAETQLVLRRFDGALSDCRELAATSRKEQVRERAAFMVGEIFFFQGEIDSAAAAYATQVETFPTGLLTNDALDRIFLFNENYGHDGRALRDVGRLHELAMRGLWSEALAIGDSLVVEYALAPVHDDLLIQVARLAESAGRPERALVHLDVLAVKYSESRLAPRALEMEGRIQEESIGDPAAALATYEDLLIRYPHSIEASEVRPRVTRLRQAVRS